MKIDDLKSGFKNYFEERAEKRRLFRSLLTDALVRKVDESGEIAVDRALLKELGATRRELFRVAYSLAIKERLHVLAGKDGLVWLLTNERFVRTAEKHARAYDTLRGVTPRAEEPLSVTDPDSEALVLEETVLVEPVTVEAEPAAKTPEAVPVETAAAAPALAGWHGFVVKSNGKNARAAKGGRENRANLPDGRKTMPPRERDPWAVLEAADIPEADATKKK